MRQNVAVGGLAGLLRGRGQKQKSNDTTIKTILEGLLPGVKIEPYTQRFINSQTDDKDGHKD